MSFIEMNHIGKYFGNLEVLKDVTLHMDAGEVVSIIGPSGSGKSTFLRCFCELEKIDKGEIIVEGEIMASRTAAGGPCMRHRLKCVRSAAVWVWYSSNLIFFRT